MNDTPRGASAPPVSPPRVGGIKPVILAAGQSRRLGRPKQLVTFAGEALVTRAARVALELAAERALVDDAVLVVTGAAHARVEATLATLDPERHRVQCLFNEAFANGLGTSLALAARHAMALPGCDALLVLLCDQPLVPAARLTELVDHFAAGRDAPVASRYEGRAGVPAILPRRLFPAVMALQGDRGARDILRAAGDRLHLVSLPEAALDVDTPASLARLRELE